MDDFFSIMKAFDSFAHSVFVMLLVILQFFLYGVMLE